MRSPAQYIRLLHPWQLDGHGPNADRVGVERLVYDSGKKQLPAKLQATTNFAKTDLAPFIRQALDAFVLLGKLSPLHAQMLVDEYRKATGGRARRRAAFEPPTTFGAFLHLLGPHVNAALDDPMTGILTGTAHRGLFGSDVGLVQAFDRIGDLGGDQAPKALSAYVQLYLRCRQHVLSGALSMASRLQSLTESEIGVPGDFFAWWRTQLTQVQLVALGSGGSVAIGLPHGIEERHASAIAGMLQSLGAEYEALARLLGERESQPGEFVRECASELNDGMVNMLLNQLGEQRCPHARDIETNVVRSGTYPTTATSVKEVTINGESLNDRFKRFFAAKHSTVVLPRTGRTIVVWRTGTCPFPDYGFVEASDRPDQISYCPV